MAIITGNEAIAYFVKNSKSASKVGTNRWAKTAQCKVLMHRVENDADKLILRKSAGSHEVLCEDHFIVREGGVVGGASGPYIDWRRGDTFFIDDEQHIVVFVLKTENCWQTLVYSFEWAGDDVFEQCRTALQIIDEL